MNKTQLISEVADKAALTKIQAKTALETVLTAITGSLKEGDQVQLVGFGTFKVNHRKARTGRNPRTGDAIQLSAVNAPAFIAGKGLKEAING
ncbi:HU family DNA-binding protein [unidentified bacterial endosymbiont]|uniref:HU family DNA-binding protein n=1 Tax=unidentified bacterial endosymbiont TaxID=2355 RepID=UPI00209E81D1|nr:HU family DNA-binding protein [unidentified bacterial endosymbiont]